MLAGGSVTIGAGVIGCDTSALVGIVETVSPRETQQFFEVLKYSPEFKDLQIVDGWAIESVDANGTFKMSAKDDPVAVQQKLLRVLKRQSDGSWKFALVSPR